MLGLWILFPAIAQARPKARIIEGVSSREGDTWVVSFRVVDSFTKKMESAISSGVVTTFTYHFDLQRFIEGWADERLYSWKVFRTIRYDNLKQQYEVILDNEGKKQSFTDFEKAKKAMVTFERLPVVVHPSLSAGEQYYVHVKAELDPIKMPVVINVLFFFMTFWDFETPWYRIDLTRIEKAPEKPAAGQVGGP
jgi:hypothetical protein